jgi:hypothetical protein
LDEILPFITVFLRLLRSKIPTGAGSKEIIAFLELVVKSALDHPHQDVVQKRLILLKDVAEDERAMSERGSCDFAQRLIRYFLDDTSNSPLLSILDYSFLHLTYSLYLFPTSSTLTARLTLSVLRSILSLRSSLPSFNETATTFLTAIDPSQRSEFEEFVRSLRQILQPTGIAERQNGVSRFKQDVISEEQLKALWILKRMKSMSRR